MEKNLVLTGWGYPEYVAAAAVALKALNGRADVRGVSRRRLPELLEEIGSAWPNVYLLGVSLSGDAPRLAAALRKLKERRVKVTWISALKMPDEFRGELGGLLAARVFADGSLLEAVGQAFKADVADILPYAGETTRAPSEVRAYRTLIDAAQFAYRNYQDESLYATAVRCLAAGTPPASWPSEATEAVRHYERYGGRELVGKSPQMTALQSRINRIAAHGDARVLILGESGTGKETVAQQIHAKSPRAREPFVCFNCASVASDLLESRFFGHEKGAFTGADRLHRGLFEQADGGTLFLDEIGEMTTETQSLLLRVLEGGRFRRLGGSDEIKVDVRLVTATNRNLPARVREGRFREDLYMRLNVVQLRIPSLREHKEDIPAIANAWWRKRHGNRTLDAVQLAALADYDYPGNVRELVNLLDRATALEEDDFAALMREHKEMNAGLLDRDFADTGATPDRLEDATRLHVRRVFEKYGQNLTRAAAALDVSRNTVRKYL